MHDQISFLTGEKFSDEDVAMKRAKFYAQHMSIDVLQAVAAEINDEVEDKDDDRYISTARFLPERKDHVCCELANSDLLSEIVAYAEVSPAMSTATLRRTLRIGGIFFEGDDTKAMVQAIKGLVGPMLVSKMYPEEAGAQARTRNEGEKPFPFERFGAGSAIAETDEEDEEGECRPRARKGSGRGTPRSKGVKKTGSSIKKPRAKPRIGDNAERTKDEKKERYIETKKRKQRDVTESDDSSSSEDEDGHGVKAHWAALYGGLAARKAGGREDMRLEIERQHIENQETLKLISSRDPSDHAIVTRHNDSVKMETRCQVRLATLEAWRKQGRISEEQREELSAPVLVQLQSASEATKIFAEAFRLHPMRPDLAEDVIDAYRDELDEKECDKIKDRVLKKAKKNNKAKNDANLGGILANTARILQQQSQQAAQHHQYWAQHPDETGLEGQRPWNVWQRPDHDEGEEDPQRQCDEGDEQAQGGQDGEKGAEQ
jgi:hypothetical protein